MTMHGFNISQLNAAWLDCLSQGLNQLDEAYLQLLSTTSDWLPGSDKIFNAFHVPLEKVRYVLIGESPYPRPQSANGFAFWDAAVQTLWSEQGLSKQVNRATSLRNLMKLLLVAEGALNPADTSQSQIAQLDKSRYVQTGQELFTNFIEQGFLLLNATPVLRPNSRPQQEARAWLPFTREVLNCLLTHNPQVSFLLWGNIANTIDKIIDKPCLTKLYSEHPYNLSFIQNRTMIDFFKPLRLLLRKT